MALSKKEFQEMDALIKRGAAAPVGQAPKQPQQQGGSNPFMDAVGSVAKTMAPATTELVQKMQRPENVNPQTIAAYSQNLSNPVAFAANLLTGQQQAKDLVKPAAEVASYVMPMGKLAMGVKPIASMVGRGAAAGALQGFSQGDDLGGMAKDAAMGGVMNPVMGGVGKVIGGIGKGLQKVTKGTLENAAGKEGLIDAKRIQHLLGADVLDTNENGAMIASDFQKLFDRQGIPINEPSIKTLGESLKNASAKIEEETVKPMLQKYYFTKSEITPVFKAIVQDNVGSGGLDGQTRKDILEFLGREQGKAYNGAKITGKAIAKVMDDKTPVTLDKLLKVKRALGQKADWTGKPFGQDPWQQMYGAIDDLIKSKLSNKDLVAYGQTFDDYSKLTRMRHRFDYALKGALPETVLSPKLAKAEKQGKNFMSSPEVQALLGLGAAGGASMIPGVGMLAGPALGLATAARYPTSANIMNKAGQGIEATMENPQVTNALQQLGVHIPNY